MVRNSAEIGIHIGDESVVPFLLDEESAQEPSEFELTFVTEGIRYRYGFVLDNERVLEEWLYAYPKGQAQKWFVRSTDGEPDWDWGTQFKGEKKKLARLTRPNALFLSGGSQVQPGAIAACLQLADWTIGCRVVSVLSRGFHPCKARRGQRILITGSCVPGSG